MKKILNTLGVVFLAILVAGIAGASFYACEIAPMEECMDEGHSFNYCNKLLNRN